MAREPLVPCINFFCRIKGMDTCMIVMIISVIVLIIAFCIVSMKSKESFAGLGHSMTYKLNREAKGPSGSFFTVPGNYQAILAPRFSNLDYGANIRYNMPATKHQAVPTSPLSYGNMIGKNSMEGFRPLVEGYPACCQSSGAGRPVSEMNMFGNVPLSAPKPMPDSQQKTDQSLLKYTEVSDMLPTSDMTAGAAPQQPIVYDRLMFANQKSRLYGQQDFIRGSLPIVPVSSNPIGGGNDYVQFRPSVHPHIDLNQGALQVIAGDTNQTNNKLKALMDASVGNTLTSFGGTPIGSMTDPQLATSVQKKMSLSGGGGDLVVTAFP